METRDIVENFYRAFNELDAEQMVSYYHKDITFRDPAFGVLNGERVKNMWRMLCHSQKGNDNFKIEVSDIQCNPENGKARWDAYYNFSKTGRKVHNIIYAEFQFKDGKIIDHVDRFDLYRWSRQALGFKGFLMGWSGFFKKKLYQQSNRLLSKFEKNHS